MLGTMHARLMGDRAVLIECVGVSPGEINAVARAVQGALAAGRLTGVTETVPAARTVLVCCDDWLGVQSVLTWVRERGVGEVEQITKPGAIPAHRPGAVTQPRTVDIDVAYDGEDLSRVAGLLGMSREAVVAAHGAAAWRAAFGGFAPGFMYLSAEDWPYRLPRLDAPRERVTAGSVALAGEFAAVYPAASPGGWQLIGRTNAELWNLDREEPALVRPGDAVRFRAMREQVRAIGSASVIASGGDTGGADTADAGSTPAEPALTVTRPGLQTLIQDDGRAGYRSVGVTASGPMDRAAYARANAAVGNPPSQDTAVGGESAGPSVNAAGGSASGFAALEVVAGGLELRVERTVTVAVAGSAVTLEIHDAGAHRSVPAATAIDLLPGQCIVLTHTGPGMRDYLAVRGGVLGVGAQANLSAQRSWLGSRSSDTLSGIGPRRLTTGDALYVGNIDGPTAPANEAAAGTRDEVNDTSELQNPGATTTVLRVLPGPRDDWFAPDALHTLSQAAWTVSAQSDRVGARLTGPAIERDTEHSESELPSEGMVRGALQVPPDGQPVLFLADHPVTGGYPVIGVVVDADLDLAGQLAPGDPVRFEWVHEAAGGRDGAWPAAQSQAARETTERPAWVPCTLEIDGRRHAIRVPGALAAALDRAWGEDATEQPQRPQPSLAEAADELIVNLVRAIRPPV